MCLTKLCHNVVDEQGTNLTGIYDMLARVLNNQQALREELEETKAELKTQVEDNKKLLDKLNTGNYYCKLSLILTGNKALNLIAIKKLHLLEV